MFKDPTSSGQEELKILYEDDYFVVFDKPAGLLVIPTPKKEKRTLIEIANNQNRAKGNNFNLHPCHRLDCDTSGAIIFAKGKCAQKAMMEIFKRAEVVKKYIALVHGRLKREQAELRTYIQDFEQRKYQRRTPPKLAITRYKVFQLKKNFSILEVQPITGRTNQIRIQFSEIGHPLVGERKYALARDYLIKFRRPALHAASIQWQHPFMKRSICVESPLPQDLKEFLNKN